MCALRDCSMNIQTILIKLCFHSSRGDRIGSSKGSFHIQKKKYKKTEIFFSHCYLLPVQQVCIVHLLVKWKPKRDSHD